MDLATKSNLENLKKIGEKILKNRVMQMNIDTGTYEPVSRNVTNDQELKRWLEVSNLCSLVFFSPQENFVVSVSWITSNVIVWSFFKKTIYPQVCWNSLGWKEIKENEKRHNDQRVIKLSIEDKGKTTWIRMINCVLFSSLVVWNNLYCYLCVFCSVSSFYALLIFPLPVILFGNAKNKNTNIQYHMKKSTNIIVSWFIEKESHQINSPKSSLTFHNICRK